MKGKGETTLEELVEERDRLREKVGQGDGLAEAELRLVNARVDIMEHGGTAEFEGCRMLDGTTPSAIRRIVDDDGNTVFACEFPGRTVEVASMDEAELADVGLEASMVRLPAWADLLVGGCPMFDVSVYPLV